MEVDMEELLLEPLLLLVAADTEVVMEEESPVPVPELLVMVAVMEAVMVVVMAELLEASLEELLEEFQESSPNRLELTTKVPSMPKAVPNKESTELPKTKDLMLNKLRPNRPRALTSVATRAQSPLPKDNSSAMARTEMRPSTRCQRASPDPHTASPRTLTRDTTDPTPKLKEVNMPDFKPNRALLMLDKPANSPPTNKDSTSTTTKTPSEPTNNNNNPWPPRTPTDSTANNTRLDKPEVLLEELLEVQQDTAGAASKYRLCNFLFFYHFLCLSYFRTYIPPFLSAFLPPTKAKASVGTTVY